MVEIVFYDYASTVETKQNKKKEAALAGGSIFLIDSSFGKVFKK